MAGKVEVRAARYRQNISIAIFLLHIEITRLKNHFSGFFIKYILFQNVNLLPNVTVHNAAKQPIFIAFVISHIYLNLLNEPEFFSHALPFE